MLVSIYDGTQLVEARECRLAQLPDGRKAAIWRGLAFPLRPSGDAIDISGEAHPPNAEPADSPRPAATAVTAHVVDGLDEAYVLVAGSAVAAERAAAGLRKAGVEVLRTGRYLGDAVDGFAADWFVRVAVPAGGEPLRERVARILGAAPEPRETEPHLRLRLVAAELARTRERALHSEAEVERLKLALAERASSETEAASLRAAVAEERQRREAAETEALRALARIESAPPIPDAVPAPPPPRDVKRLRDEIADVLAVLLPRIRLLRQGLDVVAIEFADRRALYRVLAELEHCETAMPTRWKTVQGIDGWIEKSKVGNGEDDQGRVYARLDRTDRSWHVLVSHKAEQDRDIAWLGRQ